MNREKTDLELLNEAVEILGKVNARVENLERRLSLLEKIVEKEVKIRGTKEFVDEVMKLLKIRGMVN